jgi:hypothetical protein
MKKAIIVSLVLVAVGVAVCIFKAMSTSENTSPVKEQTVRGAARTQRPDGENARRRAARRRSSKPVAPAEKLPPPKLMASVEDPEYAELDELHREIIREMQAALDADSYSSVRALVEQMIARAMRQANEAGHSDWFMFVPRLVRMKAVEALGWFGAEAITDLAAFLGDSDQSLSEDAHRLLDQALQDYDMGDRALSDVIITLMKFTNDPDMIDNYYMELSRMRNSVMISTLVEINKSGSEVAREKLPENISFYTGDFSIETVEQAEQWLEENPDGEDDDEFYGPQNQEEEE